MDGDQITADHVIVGTVDAGRYGETVAQIVLDRHTNWTDAYPAETKSTDETKRGFLEFLGPYVKEGVTPKVVYTDGSKENNKALADLNRCHDTSTPYRPQTNGVIERCGRRVKEGTTCNLIQSGLNQPWWPFAMKHYCFVDNVTSPTKNGLTAYRNRFSQDFKGILVPFGACVDFKPSSPADLDQLPKLGSKLLSGIFVGYHLHSGG